MRKKETWGFSLDCLEEWRGIRMKKKKKKKITSKEYNKIIEEKLKDIEDVDEALIIFLDTAGKYEIIK